MELSLVAHLSRELEGSPPGVRGETICFLAHATGGGAVPVDSSVSRNEA